MGWATSDLVAELKKQVLDLEADLRARVDGDDHDVRQPGVFEAWKRDYDAAFTAHRTAAMWQDWRNDRVTQAAVAWVLLTVFARYCEDNALLNPRWISGADADERTQALDARRAYFQQHPEHTDREWLHQIVGHFARFTATAGLVDRYSPLHLVAPSGDAARALLEFWWRQGADAQPAYSFSRVGTRFLGDVYENLSDYAKSTYALRQTPEFVEEFILDQTMEPALADRPLEGFTVIDPTCGSGHFLLGAFERLHERWQREAPGLGARELVEKALDGIYGVDINPFAVAIARFRLVVAALHAGGDSRIEQKIRYQPHLAAGDSLLWGANQQLLPEDLLAGPAIRPDTTEDAEALRGILQREHDVVVGNPPYITVKDAALNAMYRQLYITTHRQYALAVPFMELFFRLAQPASQQRPAGWVGQITSSSFMTRKFGKKLIEQFLPTVDLHMILDTSGAYIPGHGTPTIIIIGRNQSSYTASIRVAIKLRGEPGRPSNPLKGLVWNSIVNHINEPGFENAYVSIDDIEQQTLAKHPWSLAERDSTELLKFLDSVAETRKLETYADSTGFAAITGEDAAYELPVGACPKHRLRIPKTRILINGESVREYMLSPKMQIAWPYSNELLPDASRCPMEYLWPSKRILQVRRRFGIPVEDIHNMEWWELRELYPNKLKTPLSITFAEIATHNHFALDRSGAIFDQTAPVIKLGPSARLEDYQRLLGALNSSVSCFWLRQNCHNKGRPGAEQAGADEPWEHRYQFSVTTVRELPLPSALPLERSQTLEDLAHTLQNQSLGAVAHRTVPDAAALDIARANSKRSRGLMVACQEELDWDYYRIYGLTDEDLTYDGELPALDPAERAFAIDLARALEDGVPDTTWFKHHNHRFTSITDIPHHLPADYRDLLQRRLNAIESNPHIRVLEQPEYKRRWATEPWDKQVEFALRDWLLDRTEDRSLWYDRDGRPTTQSVAQLADVLDRDEDFRGVLRLWAADSNIATGPALAKLLADEAVPFLAAYRYRPSGLEKRAGWEGTWTLQRRQDSGATLAAAIPPPSAYTKADFLKPSYWSHRGKLDIPKERFISYPSAGRETDSTELLGWAGWNHAEQALALASLISQRIEDGWDTTTLVPLLAGLHELLPWVRQWHNEIDPEYGESVADTIDDELTARLNEHHLTVTDLTSWRPEPARRGRRTKAS